MRDEHGVEWGCGGGESMAEMDEENRFDLICFALTGCDEVSLCML
jgi:hypothetical protein